MSQMPATRRNNRADALAEQVAPPAWGPAEIRALADRVRAGGEGPWDLLVVGAGITGAG